MTREEAIEEINKTFEPAFANYIIMALGKPEVIRCKDCKYCVDYGMGGYYCESEDIVPVGNYVEPDGFCNFARRREE